MGVFKGLFGKKAVKESDSVFGQTTLGNLALLSNYLGKGNWKSNQAVYVTTSAVTDSGRAIDVGLISQNATYMSGAYFKARTLAQLPTQIYCRTPEGRKVDALTYEGIGSRDLARAKQVFALLENPNNFQSRYEWLYQMSLHLDLLGESFTLWWRENQQDQLQIPMELYQLDPTLITTVVDDMRYPRYKLSSPSYGYQKGDDLMFWQVMHLKDAGWQGSSGFNKATKAVELIALDQAIDYLANYYMENAPKIGGVFSTDQTVPQAKWEEYANRLKEQFSKFSGPASDKSQPGQVMLLDQGLKFIATEMPNLQSSDIAKLKQQTTNRICALLGVPSALINNADSKYNNTATILDEYYKSTLMPLLANLEAKLTRHLLKGYPNLSVHFSTDDLLKGAPLDQANYVVALKNAGIMTPNEARCYLGMANHEDETADDLASQNKADGPITGTSPQDTGGGGGSNKGQPKLRVVGDDE